MRRKRSEWDLPLHEASADAVHVICYPDGFNVGKGFVDYGGFVIRLRGETADQPDEGRAIDLAEGRRLAVWMLRRTILTPIKRRMADILFEMLWNLGILQRIHARNRRERKHGRQS